MSLISKEVVVDIEVVAIEEYATPKYFDSRNSGHATPKCVALVYFDYILIILNSSTCKLQVQGGVFSEHLLPA